MTIPAKKKPLVTLGVTGCIGAYKAPEILRRLQDKCLDIQPVLTSSAQQFITPLTLQSLAHRRAVTDLWDEKYNFDVQHISLSDETDVLLIAPATANIIAKMANGIADDFLSTFYLACNTPVVIAPAMNSKMYAHPATQENITRLKQRGVKFVEPGKGYLACGWEGQGRLAEVADIVEATLHALRLEKTLQGKKVVVTAGPTAEDIDPMRFITNRSSGKMGYALASEARARGAEVTLISGPVNLRPPHGVNLINIRSAEEMFHQVMKEAVTADIVCKVAAVADYCMESTSPEKIKKSDDNLSLDLVRTKDILAELGKLKEKPFLVGFAAESENILKSGQAKLKSKNADIFVANNIKGPDGVTGKDSTSGIIICADGKNLAAENVTKAEMSGLILDQVEKRIK
jgi:phosphopantothenoylcysteine decarboxylase/phosphopantothenate--cysteine ligase